MHRCLVLFFGLLVSSLAMAQQGSLVGKVVDKKTGEGVIGATVLVTGTTQAAPVDVEGNYELKLDPGTYNITMTYIGYKPLTFPGVQVRASQKTTLNGSMEENATALKEVTVTGQKQTGTEVAMIQDLKKSEVVVSGMSNDQIVKTLDRDAAEVVKRIPGVTIQSNNFIVIRGLAERYNTVLLNDALTPSAEVDTRSFSFDILPSSVIDRVLIFKSGSPELPGEMGGGVVKVYTKNSVLENSGSLSVSSWYRASTTFNDFRESNHSGTDWLGFDNGQRQLPNSGDGEVAAFGPKLRNDWAPRLTTARPDMRFSLGLNRKFEIGQTYLSNVTSISYSNTRELNNVSRQRIGVYDPVNEAVLGIYDYNDQRSLTAARLGVIHNWQVRVNDRNRFEFRNFLNQYGTDEVVRRTGVSFQQDVDHDEYAIHYQSRTIYSGQLGGTHEFGSNSSSTVTWAGGYNYVSRDEPDYRRYQNIRPRGEVSIPFQIVIPFNATLNDASRFYSDLRENTYMGQGQFEKRLTFGRDTLDASPYKVRVGFYAEDKNRNFRSRVFSYIRGQNFDPTLATLPIETIFSPQNIRSDGGFELQEDVNPVYRYEASNRLIAGYVGVVAPVSDKLSISGGVRVENNRRSVIDGRGDEYKEVRTIPMPSINTTYNFNDRSLLRLGGSVTVNRPEFREVSQNPYFDFSTNTIVIGNTNLRTASIYNGDLRYEFYPTRSEMVSVGVFYKHFTDAIEQTIAPVGGEQLTVTYANAPTAYDYGVEVELRKGLLDLTQNVFLQHFSFVLNGSLIKSEVNLDDDARQILNRPLQGQSPYVVNTGVFYQDDERRWQISAQYNVVGPRIILVGDRNQNYSVIDRPRNILDLAVTKGLGQHFDLRVGIQDIINQAVRQNYDLNRNNKIDTGSIEEKANFGNYRRGSYSTIGLTYKF